MNIHPNNKKMLRKARKMRNREVMKEVTPSGTARRNKRKKYSDWVNEVGEFA